MKLNLVIIYFVYGYVSTYPYKNIKIESPIQVRMMKSYLHIHKTNLQIQHILYNTNTLVTQTYYKNITMLIILIRLN